MNLCVIKLAEYNYSHLNSTDSAMKIMPLCTTILHCRCLSLQEFKLGHSGHLISLLRIHLLIFTGYARTMRLIPTMHGIIQEKRFYNVQSKFFQNIVCAMYY